MHSSVLPVKVQEKQYLFRFIHALACLFKDVSEKQGVLSCPLRYKDILIVQLPLSRSSFFFRELCGARQGPEV